MMAGVVNAQGLSGGDSGSRVFCKRDFGNFLAIGIDFGGEGFIDYWDDILIRYSRNYCHYADIASLLDRIDKIRKQLRQAFYVCDANTTARLTDTYQRLSAELWYLRHFIKTKEPANPDGDEEIKKDLVQKTENFQKEFVSRFADKYEYFSKEDAIAEFERFEDKYEFKLETYRNCVDPNYTLLMAKIEDLSDTLENVKNMVTKFEGGLVDDFKTRVATRAAQTQERVEQNPGLVSAFDPDSSGGFFSHLVDARINSQEPAVFWEEFTSYSPDSGRDSGNMGGVSRTANAPYTYQEALSDIQRIEERDLYKNLDIEYVTEYDNKYRQTADRSLDDLLKSLRELDGIIVDTYPELEKIHGCTSRIIGKQCGGK